MSEDPSTAVNESTSRAPLRGAARYSATLALLLWVGFIVFMCARSSVSEIEWTRLAWVFASVEGVAFAAAGALWGTTVQRVHTQKAEDRADSAEKKASKSQEMATRGLALSAALQAEDVVNEDDGDGEIRSSSGIQDPVVRRHARMAAALFGPEPRIVERSASVRPPV